MKFFCLPALVAGSMIFAVPLSHAQTVTGEMIVSAYIRQACSLSAAPMAFGSIVAGADAQITTKVTLECTSAGALTTFTVGAGRHSGAGNLRQMDSDGTKLAYTLHLDGDTITELAHNGAVTLVKENGLDEFIYSVEIVGKVTTPADASDGVYTDLVTLTTQYDFTN